MLLLYTKNFLFYTIKPLIPRQVQIFTRRHLAKMKKEKYKDIWPINNNTANQPFGWKGWPNGNKFALVLQHDVDTQNGHDKCHQLMDLEEKLDVRSCFYVVPERYTVSQQLLDEIKQRGFGLGVHGLKHDGKLFLSYAIFRENAAKVNHYLHSWNVRGFSAPSMISRLDWMHHLDIDFSTSTFDTDPFEPQPVPVNTIFPFKVCNESKRKCFVELPYTLPQDFTLFIILQEKTIDIWKNKLDWIAQNGGMALVNVHPDYMNFNNTNSSKQEYPAIYYEEFLCYIKRKYKNHFWLALPEEVAEFSKQTD